MNIPLHNHDDALCDTIQATIEAALEGAKAEVQGGHGHFQIQVTCAALAGQSRLNQQRAVLRLLAPLMEGDNAPVHAIDSLRIQTQ